MTARILGPIVIVVCFPLALIGVAIAACVGFVMAAIRRGGRQ